MNRGFGFLSYKLARTNHKLDYNTARRIMGDEKFVGVAITTQRQAELASRANASYVVIGPVYKPLPGEFHSHSIHPLGTAGVREILNYCSTFEKKVPYLVSGGITVDNVQRVVFQSRAESKSVDGVVLHYPVTYVFIFSVCGAVDLKLRIVG